MVKPGYKLTELGKIPEDWECVSLGQICSIVTGKKDVNEGNPSGQYPFFTCSRNLSFSDGYSFDCEAILIAGNGEVGNLHYYNGKFEAYQRTYVILQFQVNTKYVYNSLEYRLKDELGIGKIGSSIPYIKKENLEEFTFFLPNPEEQSAIVSTLSDIDALLDSLDALIAKKRAVKQAAMQELLTGKVRLPGFCEEWNEKLFHDIFIKLNTKQNQIQSSEYEESGKYPVVDQGKKVIIGFSSQEDKVFICPEDGVIVFGDHTCFIKFVDFNFLIGADGTQIIKCKEGQYTKFYAHQLKFNGITSTGYNRHFRFLKEKIFAVPSLSEQIAIAAVLSDMDTEIEALEARRAKTAQIKQGMMQELLTGKTRLPPFGAMSLG